MKIEESLNVTFGETLSLSKTSPLVDDDLDEKEAIKVIEKKNLENDIEDETLKVDEIVNIKQSKNHPLDNVIGNLNQRTLRDLKTQLETVAKNHQALIQNLKTKFDRLADKQSGRPSGSLLSNTQPNPRADLGASINLMPYSLYAKLSLKTLKPTKMSVRLADRSFQYPVGIAKIMLVKVGNSPSLSISLFSKWKKIARSLSSWGDLSFTLLMHINVIVEILEEYFDALLDEGSKILHFIEGTILE
nr:reverse transcriptase domain-containing protein [Tanacetum cinerariifolium]